MSTITNLQVKLYSTQEEPVNPVNPDIPDTAGDPDTGLYTVIDTTNGQDGINIDIAPIAFTAFILLITVAFVLPKLIKKFHKNDTERYDLNSKKFRNFRFLSTILASSSLLIGLVSTAMGYVPQKTEELSADAAKQVVIDAPILDTNDMAVVHTTIKVPASRGEFKLYITSVSSDLVNIHNPADRIPSITEKGTLKDNTYGIYVGKDKPTANSEFYPVYTDETGIYSIFSAESSSKQTIDIWYGVRSKSNYESTYETNLKIKVLNTSRFAMQEMTSEICASFEQGVYDLYELYDTRDGKVYKVARYGDGNCWMVDTLDLDLSTKTTLTSADTDLPDGVTYTPNIDTSTDVEEWKYIDLKDYKQKVINYYNLLKNLYSEECNVDNAHWCREQGEEGYSDWINRYHDTILSSVFWSSTDSSHLWDESVEIHSWEIFTEEDYAILRQRFYEVFGVTEFTEANKAWHDSGFKYTIDYEAASTISDDNLWNNECDKYNEGTEEQQRQKQSWCEVETRYVKELIRSSIYLDDTYKNFNEYSFDTKNQSEGNFYNLFALTAGTAEAEEVHDSYTFNATGSICPANWHLATDNEFIHAVEESEVGKVMHNGDGYIIFDRVLSHKNQNFLPKSGVGIYVPYNDDDFFQAGVADIGVVKEALGVNVFSFGNLGLLLDGAVLDEEMPSQMIEIRVGTTEFSEMGSSVRCVADYGDFTLTFDQNTDAKVNSLPENRSKEMTPENRYSGVEFTIPDTIPTREDNYNFLGWAKTIAHANAGITDYLPGDKILVTGAAVTLYAVWDEPEPERNPKAIHTENDYLTFVYDRKKYRVGDMFETADGENSKILEVYRRDAFEDYEQIEGDIPDATSTEIAIDNIFGGMNANYFPGWSVMRKTTNPLDVPDDDEHQHIYYNNYSFDGSFKEYTPHSTQGWFAYAMAIKDSDIENGIRYLNTENLNTSEVINMRLMFFVNMMGSGDTSDSRTVEGIKLDVSSWDVSKVKYMDFMFAGILFSGPWKEIKGIENWKTKSLTSALLMFLFGMGSDHLSLDFSKWDTSNLVHMAGMFDETAWIPGNENEKLWIKVSGVEKWNTKNVADMEDVFHSAYLDYSSLDLSGWDTSKVTNMSGMFANLHVSKPDGAGSTTLNLHGWNTSNVTDMTGMFGVHDNALLSVKEGAHVDIIDITSNVTYNNGQANYSGWDIEKVTAMDRMFSTGDYTTIRANRDWTKNTEPYRKVIFFSYDGYSYNQDKDGDYYCNYYSGYIQKNPEVDRELFEIDENGDYYFKEDGSDHNVSSVSGRYVKKNNKFIGVADFFKDSSRIAGDHGTTYVNSSFAYARPDGGTSAPGYFTNPYDDIQDAEPEPEYSGSSLSPTDGQSGSTNEPGNTNNTNPQDGNTEPYGVIRKAKATDKTDYALIIVTILSIALVLLGAFIIFLIEKRDKDEDDDIEEY